MSNQFGDIHPAMSEVSEGAPSGQPNKTTWPTVVGVIGIILASLFVLQCMPPCKSQMAKIG